jgi:DNA-directed RNA polymerase subunit F
MKIIDSRNLTYLEVAKIIDEIKSKGYELDQLAIRVNEYANKFNKCKGAQSLVKELLEIGLKEISAVMIANIVPQNEDEVKALLNFEHEIPDAEVIKKILEKVKAHC